MGAFTEVSRWNIKMRKRGESLAFYDHCKDGPKILQKFPPPLKPAALKTKEHLPQPDVISEQRKVFKGSFFYQGLSGSGLRLASQK